MNTKSWVQLGLVVVLGAATLAMFFRGGDSARIDFNPYQALGAVAAEEVSKTLGGQGRVVLVVPDSGTDRDPVLDSQVDAFKSSLESAGAVEFAGLFPVAMTPFERMGTGGAMPAGQFPTLRVKFPDATAYVFFIGFPAMPESEFPGLKTGPKLMVVSAPLPGYDLLLREGVLQFAIVSKTVAADASTTPAKTTRESFDQEYLILRPEN